MSSENQIDSRRLKIVIVQSHEILGLFRDYDVYSLPRFEGIPDDAEVVEVHNDYAYNGIAFLIRHPSFESVPLGMMVPAIQNHSSVHLVRKGALLIPHGYRNINLFEDWMMRWVDERNGPAIAIEAAEMLSNNARAISNAISVSADLERFKRGELTDEEFQGLCHNLERNPELSPEKFAQGCAEYQIKLFGKCPTKELIKRLIDGIKWWADQEDGVPEDVWDAYADAVEFTTGKRPAPKD